MPHPGRGGGNDRPGHSSADGLTEHVTELESRGCPAFLARRGKAVELFERRPDMRKRQISAGRSINLAISVRGLHALAQVGLEQEALAHAIPMPGRMIHARDGGLAFQAYGKDDSQCIHSISRGFLNRMLLDAAEKTGRVLSVEEHSVVGGLGTIVAETVASAGLPVRLAQVALPAEDLEVGVPADLYEHYGLTAANVAEKARNLIGR